MSKGYAALLRQGSLPVSAGLLDVYGQVGAVLCARSPDRQQCPAVSVQRPSTHITR
jgi:hypothetical protein